MTKDNILNIPNSLTVLRIWLAMPIIYFLINKNYAWASIIFVISAITDALDGFLAKRLNQVTKFGTILDPIADKVLINYTFLLFAINKDIPQLLFFVVLAKDIGLIVGSMVEIFSLDKPDKTKIKASLVGKVSMVSQVLLIFFIFLERLDFYKNSALKAFFVDFAVILAILAFVDYSFKRKDEFFNKGVNS